MYLYVLISFRLCSLVYHQSWHWHLCSFALLQLDQLPQWVWEWRTLSPCHVSTSPYRLDLLGVERWVAENLQDWNASKAPPIHRYHRGHQWPRLMTFTSWVTWPSSCLLWQLELHPSSIRPPWLYSLFSVADTDNNRARSTVWHVTSNTASYENLIYVPESSLCFSQCVMELGAGAAAGDCNLAGMCWKWMLWRGRESRLQTLL